MKNRARTKSINKKQVKAVKKKPPPSQKSLLSKKKEETSKNKHGLEDFPTLRKRSTKPRISGTAEKYWNILENIQDGCFEVDLPGNFTFLNDSVCRVLGYSREELMKMNVRQLSDKETLKKVFQATNEVYKTGKPIKEFGWQVMRKDGAERYIQGSISLRKDSSGNPIGFLVIANDSTDRKQAEIQRELALDALLKSEEKYRSLAENMSDIVTEMNSQGIIVYISPSHQKIFGDSSQDMVGTSAFDRVHPEDRDRVMVQYIEGVRTKTDREVEYRFRHIDGHYVWLRSLGHSFYDAAGEYVGSIISSSDISERKKADEALRQSEERYRTLVENASDIIFRTDNTGHFTFVNPAALRIIGYEEEVIIGMHYSALIHPDMRSEAIKFFGRQFVKGLNNTYSEYPIITKDGHEVWFGQNTQLIVENGNVIGFQSMARDITERKQIEGALRKSEENFRLSLDSSPLGVRISTIEAETIYANRAILDIYGYDSIEELNKTPVKERYTPQSYAEYEIRKEKRKRGEFVPSEYEISIVRKNGEIRNIQVYRKEVIWNGAKQSQVIYKDITEQKQAEERLKETLESLRKSIKTTIQVLGTASEARDPYTAGHQKRVANLARAIATEMGLPNDKIEGLRMAGSIHDIGKISIPSEILSKPTQLTNIEFSLIKEHSRVGYEMLKDVESPWPIAEIVYQHHERLNGSGYPRNLKGNEILIESQILAVTDVMEAMASYRPYRAALGIEAALEEIETNKGTLYGNAVADACLRLFREKGYQLT